MDCDSPTRSRTGDRSQATDGGRGHGARTDRAGEPSQADEEEGAAANPSAAVQDVAR